MPKIFIFFLVTAMIISCNDTGRKTPDFSAAQVTIEEDTSPPVITTKFNSIAFPSIFEVAFSDNTTVLEGGTKYFLLKLKIGLIKIKSGKVIACDPIVMQDGNPFTENFPVGEFPVDLAIAKTSNDHRVAFSRIIFSNNPVAKWEFALKEGQLPISLTDTSTYCYGVDAGMGLFIDSVSNNSFKLAGQSSWDNAFMNDVEQLGHIYDFGEHNLATFNTGYGDGCYSTYIGRDSSGKACQLLTDFGIVSWWRIPQQ